MALDEPGHVVPVLGEEALVEPEVAAELGPLVRRCPNGMIDLDGVARQEPDQQEREEADDDEDDDQLDQPPSGSSS